MQRSAITSGAQPDSPSIAEGRPKARRSEDFSKWSPLHSPLLPAPDLPEGTR